MQFLVLHKTKIKHYIAIAYFSTDLDILLQFPSHQSSNSIFHAFSVNTDVNKASSFSESKQAPKHSPILMTGGRAVTATASSPARPSVAPQMPDGMAHGAKSSDASHNFLLFGTVVSWKRKRTLDLLLPPMLS